MSSLPVQCSVSESIVSTRPGVQQCQAQGQMGGPCDYCVSPSPFGLDFGTLYLGLTITSVSVSSLSVSIVPVFSVSESSVSEWSVPVSSLSKLSVSNVLESNVSVSSDLVSWLLGLLSEPKRVCKTIISALWCRMAGWLFVCVWCRLLVCSVLYKYGESLLRIGESLVRNSASVVSRTILAIVISGPKCCCE